MPPRASALTLNPEPIVLKVDVVDVINTWSDTGDTFVEDDTTMHDGSLGVERADLGQTRSGSGRNLHALMRNELVVCVPQFIAAPGVGAGMRVSHIGYLSIKNRSAATTLSPAVSDRYGAGPRSFGATFWIPGVKTERTAKKRRKNEQKWARYGLL